MRLARCVAGNTPTATSTPPETAQARPGPRAEPARPHLTGPAGPSELLPGEGNEGKPRPHQDLSPRVQLRGGGGGGWTGPLRPPAAGRPCRRHTHLRPSSPAPHLSPLAASPPTGTERLRGRQAIAHPMQMSRPPPALHWSAQLLSGLPLAGRAFHHSPIGYPLLAPEAGSRACATCRGGPVGSAVRLVENPGGGVGQSRAPLLPGVCCGASGRS